MNIIMLMAVFIMMAGVAVFYCNLFGLNPAEGMVPAVLTVIAAVTLAVSLTGNYLLAVILIAALAVLGLVSSIYKWYKAGKVSFGFLLSPYFIALTAVFIISILIYYGDTIQNIDELRLWAMADKYMFSHDSFYLYDDVVYMQGTNLFRYLFLKISGFQEGSIYALSALLYWIGLLLPFGKIGKEKWPRLLLYILLMHIGLYSMYYYGSKSCSPELALACWIGGMAGWWITREKKKTNIVVLLSGLISAFTFTETVNAVLLIFVLLLPVNHLAGSYVNRKKDPAYEISPETEQTNTVLENSGDKNYGHIDLYCFLAAFMLFFAAVLLYGNLTAFTYLKENMTYFLRCLVENNMTLWKADLNYTFIFNIVLVAVLLVAVIDQQYQRKLAARYIIYSIMVSAIYISVLIFSAVNDQQQIKKEYIATIQRMISLLVIYLFVMALSWLLCEKRLLEKKTPYIPGLILLVVFLYGVNKNYLTNATAAYPEKNNNYSTIQRVKRQCAYLEDRLETDEKVYFINQGKEIASVEARFILGNQISDSSLQAWKFSVNGGMVKNQIDPYKPLSALPAALKEEQYSYVWIYKTNSYLNRNLPKVMGNEMEDMDENAADYAEELISKSTVSGGQIYQVLYNKKKVLGLKLDENIVPYDNRRAYYRWNDIIFE